MRRLAAVLVLAGVGWLLPVAPASAAPPANDAFPGTTVAALPLVEEVDVGEATSESGEPGPCNNFAYRTVWYSYTPSTDRRILIEALDTDDGGGRIGVYTGTALKELTAVACRARFTSSPVRLSLDVAAGVTYRIQASAYYSTGELLRVTIHDPPPPLNDDVAEAIDLGAVPVDVSVDLAGATSEAGERQCLTADQGTSAWYAYTPATDETVVLDVVAGESANLAVYDPSMNRLACTAYQVRLDPAAGTRYLVRVSGRSYHPGTVRLRLRDPLPNDDRAGPTDLAPGSNATVDTSKATREADEPNDCFISHSAWYRISGTDAVLRLDAATGDWSGRVAIFAPDEPALCLFSSDGVVSHVFEVHADETYLLQVGSLHGSFPTVQLELSTVPPPPHDTAAGAADLVYGVAAAADTGGATSAGEPAPACGLDVGATVWYRITAPADGPMLVSTFGSDFDTVVTVRDASLDEVACDDDHNGITSRAVVNVTAGTTYLVQVGGFRRARGNLVLHAGPDPLNDDFADALTVPLPGTAEIVDTTRATVEGGEPDNLCIPSYDTTVGTVWYRVDVPAPGAVVVDTSGSDFDVTLGLWRGEDVHHLEMVACADGAATDVGGTHIGFTQPLASTSLSVQEAGTYMLQVGGRQQYYPTVQPPTRGLLNVRIAVV